jgi:hypothetical protein
MLKYFCSFFKSLEQWEKYQPSSFWLCSIGLYISFSAGFGALFPESPRQSHVVIEQVRGGGTEDSGSSTSSAYIPPGRTTPRQTNPGTQDKTIKSSPKEYEPKPGIRLSAGGNPGDSGIGPSSWEEDNLIPPEERWKDDPDYWADYKYNREDFKKKKKLEEEVCSISDPLQNKAGIEELPDSSSGKYLYKIDTKAAREELDKVWKDPKAKKETLSKLEKIEKGELTSRNQKSLQGFKKLKEYKFNRIRIIVEPGQKGAPEQIVGIVKRSRLTDLMKTFKNKFK